MSVNESLRAAVEGLGGEDLLAAESGARWLCEFCDGSTGNKTSNRVTVGQLRGIWGAFHKALQRQDAKPLRAAALDALGFIAFEDALNSGAITSNTELLGCISDILGTGSADEKISAAGTIANLTVSDDNMTAKMHISGHRSLVNNLASLFDPSKTNTADRLVQFRGVGAFNNMARCSEAGALLDSHGIPSVLERFIRSVMDESDQEILVARTAMALAGLMGRLEFSNLPRKSAMMQLIVKCLEHAINRLEGKNGMFGNVLWTCSVVLYPLYQLSIADSNKQDLVDAGVVEELLRLVRVWKLGEGGGTRDLEWALLSLEQLSFNDNARDRIRSIIDDTSVPTLATLHRLSRLNPDTELPKTRDTGGSVGQMVANLMANVCPEQAPSPMAAMAAARARRGSGGGSASGGEGSGQWVMISYNWDVQDKAKELCEGLRQNNFVVWMDILDGCMEGDTLQAMANAVGQAAVVIVCVTSKYKESANCRREASYANELNKPIIPVIMEPDYQPDGSWGWLGLIIAGKLYYDLSDPSKFSSQMAALLRAEEFEFAQRLPPGDNTNMRSTVIKRLKSTAIASRAVSAMHARIPSAASTASTDHSAESFRAVRARSALAKWSTQGSQLSLTSCEMNQTTLDGVEGDGRWSPTDRRPSTLEARIVSFNRRGSLSSDHIHPEYRPSQTQGDMHGGGCAPSLWRPISF